MATTRERARAVRSVELPGGERALAERVAERLGAVGARGAAADTLGGREAGAEPEDVADALARLRAEGRAIDRQGRWYAVAATDWEAGRVDRLDGGDAMIRPLAGDGPGPRRGGEPAYLVEARHLKGALDGDLVLVKRLKGRPRDAAGRKLLPAAVVEIVERRSERVVGTLETDADGRRWLAPYDARSNLELEVVESERVPDDHFVVVSVRRGSGQRGASHPLATVVEDLGHAEAPGTDVRAVLRHYRIPDEFPPEVLAAAAAFPSDPGPEDFAGREDLRGVTTVTIDGATARDFDDAITCEPLGGGLWRLGVHIADVSHYVEEGGAIDREAYRRGTSVYYPDRAVPMLPESLSNGLCSLRPGVPRLTLSAFLDVDRDGEVRRRRFARTVIRSDRRMTYDEVRRLVEEPRPGDEGEVGREVLALIGECAELMRALLAARAERGSIDFDLPEGDVILDTDGVTVGIIPGERHVAHRLIEECMIAANEAVALELETAEVPALYRVHDAPAPDDLEGLAEVLASLGFRLPRDLERLHPRHLQAVLAEAAGSENEHFVASLVLGTMQRAVYTPENRGHYGLASRHYTHFTSPIRRYPDLVVHRRLKERLAGEAGGGRGGRGGGIPIAERLPGIAEHAGTMERRAEQSERDLLQWKKVRFLASRVGETFPGRITGVQPFGLFVQLEKLYVDGLVPIRSLADDYYLFEPEAHRLVGSNRGRVFRLADRVPVRLVGVSLRHRGLDLEIADLAEPSPRRRGRSR
ncbi:MAG TPA: ribonuclease R [Thermoanaerobaculia bacterium]|nr:ribonuclease R [Thermoanaerobaculia bacterium]